MKIYVDQNAARSGNGSREMPFRRINDAAQAARPGDEVLVAPGVYREYVNPRYAGTEDARITYRSTTPLGAVITGAEAVKDWKPYQGTVWVCRIDNSIFGNYNPYTTYVYGDWYFAGRSRHTGAVYLNDRMMYEAETLENVSVVTSTAVPGNRRLPFTNGMPNRKAARRSSTPISRERIPTGRRWRSTSAGNVSCLPKPVSVT